MGRPTISLAVIALNENDNLKQLTKSIQGCFDEIILVDTGSKDNTMGTAINLGWKVSQFKWIDNFAAARNFSFAQAKSDYVMWLDCDDVLADAKSFIQWRDTIMGSADFWLATYHYAQDVRGNPVCSHARERVIRRSKGFEWVYFIHEGIKPINPHEKINCQFVTSWAVRHMRTMDDLNKDHSRNLNLFDKNKDNLDSRMLWYYGKELFETGDHVAAIPKLVDAISSAKLEAHDRLLAIQYLGDAYMKAAQPEQAIRIAHNGLQLNPNHAEFWGQIGNAYMMKGNMNGAILFYKAATTCQLPSNAAANQSGAIFNLEAYYRAYPRTQLAKCLAQVHRFDEAEIEAKEAVRLYGDEEAKKVLSEVSRIKASTIELSDAPREKVGDIVFTVPPGIPYEFDPDLRNERGLGGSETALIEMAKELATLTKAPIKVFTPRSSRKEMSRDGVEYLDIQKSTAYFGKYEPKLHIAWRHNLPVTKGRTLIWNHDLYSIGLDQTDRYYKALALSKFHKAFLMSMLKIPPDKIAITRNGISPEDAFDGFDVAKNPNKIMFSSSPDRGLDRAIKVVEMAREKLPNLELHVAYGFEGVRKVNPQGAESLERLAYQYDWVKLHGNLKKPDLRRHFVESAIWLYPTNFLETFCITALEALAYRAYPIVRRYGALQDTLEKAEKHGCATLIDNFAETDEELKVFADAVVGAVQKKMWTYHTDFFKIEDYSWNTVAREWCEQFLEMKL